MHAPSPLPVELSCELRAARDPPMRGWDREWSAGEGCSDLNISLTFASSEDDFRVLIYVAIHLLCFKLPT